MTRRALIPALLLACGALAPAAPARADGLLGSPTDPASLAARVPGLEGRLTALAPASPAAYFELGEEVAQEASTADERRLGRQLLALAVELNRAAPTRDAQLERSACLALAARAETEADARWLRALAASLEGSPAAGPAAGPARVAPPREPAALDLCAVLSFARTGEGRRASAILNQPEVSRLLESCDRLLGNGVPGGASRVRKAIDDWPACPQCRNRRSVKDQTGVHLCPFCHGTPGPQISQAELVAQLRTEATVLAGSQRSWAGQIIADAGAPLRELDVAEIAPSFGVSAATPLWRDGKWVADPSAKPAPAPGAAAPADGPGGATAPAQPAVPVVTPVPNPRRPR
jgi:hypothetical protein